MSEILPILFILLVIMLFIIFLFRGSKGLSINFLQGRKAYMLLGSYIAILLIAVGLFLLNPFPTKPILSKEADPDKVFSSHLILNDVVFEGKSIYAFDDYIENKWEFEFKEDQFSVKMQSDESYMPIAIDEKEVDDGIIEVTSYRTPTIVAGMDVTDQIDAVSVTFSSDALQIMVGYNKLSFVTFEQEFTSKQFTSNPTILSEDDYREIHIGEDLLYIRIPKDVKVEEPDNLYLEYVE